MKTKRGELLIVTLFIGVMLIGIISAAGSSCDNWETNPLSISKGETKVVNCVLQNMGASEDITFKAEIKLGSDILSITKDTYIVPANTADTKVPLKITIPENINETVKKVRVEFKQITSGADGMVNLGTGSSVVFDVLISEASGNKKLFNSTNTLIIAIILLAIVIVALMIKKKSGKKK